VRQSSAAVAITAPSQPLADRRSPDGWSVTAGATGGSRWSEDPTRRAPQADVTAMPRAPRGPAKQVSTGPNHGEAEHVAGRAGRPRHAGPRTSR
jgi:hypothetical protein